MKMNKMHSFFEICLLSSNRFSFCEFNETAIVFVSPPPFTATIPAHLLIGKLSVCECVCECLCVCGNSGNELATFADCGKLQLCLRASF